MIETDDGVELALWDEGEKGIPVVFLHGFPENHHSWDALIKNLPAKVRNRFRLIRYDLRGFGESAKTGEASLHRLYEDHQQVIKALRLPKYHLVGHDWGGAIALHTARQAPETLRSMTVLNTNYWKTDLFGMWHLLFLNLPAIPKLAFNLIPTRLFRMAIRAAFVQPARLNRQVAESFLKMFHDPSTIEYWIRLYRNMGKGLLGKKLPSLQRLFSDKLDVSLQPSPKAYQVPTCLIWGQEDRFNPPWIGEDIRSRLSQKGCATELHLVKDAGHFVHEEKPEAVVKLILKHWQSCK